MAALIIANCGESGKIVPAVGMKVIQISSILIIFKFVTFLSLYHFRVEITKNPNAGNTFKKRTKVWLPLTPSVVQF